MSFFNRLVDDVNRIFLGQSTFEKDITYQSISGTSSAIKALIEEDHDLSTGGELDDEFTPGLGAIARIQVSEFDIPFPEYGDQIIDGPRTWNVQQKKRVDGLWELVCTDDERISR